MFGILIKHKNRQFLFLLNGAVDVDINEADISCVI